MTDLQFLKMAIQSRDALEQAIIHARVDLATKAELVKAHAYECERVNKLLAD